MAHIHRHQQHMHSMHMQHQQRMHQQTQSHIWRAHNNFHQQQIHRVHQDNHRRHMQFHQDQMHRAHQNMHQQQQQHHQRMRDEADRRRREDDNRRMHDNMRRMHQNNTSSSFGSRPTVYYTVNGEQGELTESLLGDEGGSFTINFGGAPGPLIQKDEGTGNLILQESTFTANLQYYILCIVAVSFLWFPIVSLIAFFAICTLEHKWIVFDKQQRAIVLFGKKVLGSKTHEKKRIPFEDLEALQLAAQGNGFTDLLVKPKNKETSLLLYTDYHYSQQQRLEQLQDWFDELNGVKRQEAPSSGEQGGATSASTSNQQEQQTPSAYTAPSNEKMDSERHQPSAPPPPADQQ